MFAVSATIQWWLCKSKNKTSSNRTDKGCTLFSEHNMSELPVVYQERVHLTKVYTSLVWQPCNRTLIFINNVSLKVSQLYFFLSITIHHLLRKVSVVFVEINEQSFLHIFLWILLSHPAIGLLVWIIHFYAGHFLSRVEVERERVQYKHYYIIMDQTHLCHRQWFALCLCSLLISPVNVLYIEHDEYHDSLMV